METRLQKLSGEIRALRRCSTKGGVDWSDGSSSSAILERYFSHRVLRVAHTFWNARHLVWLNGDSLQLCRFWRRQDYRISVLKPIHYPMHNYITWEWALSDARTVAFEFAAMNVKQYNIAKIKVDVIHCISFAFCDCDNFRLIDIIQQETRLGYAVWAYAGCVQITRTILFSRQWMVVRSWGNFFHYLSKPIWTI